MADVASTLRAWSATPGNNSPSGLTLIGANLDDNLREMQAVVRKYLASAGSNMTAGSTVDLSTADGYYVTITGTTTITSFGTESAGISYLLRFAGALTLTHNATSLILPGAANITTAAGDMALMISEGSGNWRCAHFRRAAGPLSSDTAFSPAGTGAVTRTVQAKLREYPVSVVDFGAVNDGSTDNSTAFQNCVTYCVANQRDMFIPQGTWNLTSGISITGKIKIFGEGKAMTLVKLTGGTLTAFTVNTASAVEFHSMWIYGVTPGASNCAISLTGSGSGNSGTFIRDVLFDAFYDPLITVSAYAWTVDNCTFNDWTHNAVTVANAAAPDAGDSTIANCLFANAGASARGVFQSSSGGLRVINNKINGGAYGVLVDLSAGVTTSILIVTGNSIENQSTSGVRVINTAGTASFSQVLIDGNQFYNQATPIALDDTASFINSCVISDNIIICASGATTTAAITATAVPAVSIDDNVIYGSGSTVVGISIGSGSTNAQEGNNLIYGCATAVSNSSSNTVASATSITLPVGFDVVQISGTTSITSIAAASARKGRVVTLVFQGILTFTDGSNLKLAGNFVTTADDTITLCCADGTNWYEIARSAN